MQKCNDTHTLAHILCCVGVACKYTRARKSCLGGGWGGKSRIFGLQYVMLEVVLCVNTRTCVWHAVGVCRV